MQGDDLKTFQRWHKDWNGNRLKDDGDLGPKTEWAMAISLLDPRRQAIVERACGNVGHTELAGANRSPLIDDWLRRCGAELGSPWCAAFASWCVSVPGLPEVRQASAQELGRSLRVPCLIQAGDVMWFPTGKATGHCGIVVGLGPGEVACVEGNHGNQVRLVRRSMLQVRFGSTAPMVDPPGIPPGLPLVAVAYEGTR
jgi:hypothetical protein